MLSRIIRAQANKVKLIILFWFSFPIQTANSGAFPLLLLRLRVRGCLFTFGTNTLFWFWLWFPLAIYRLGRLLFTCSKIFHSDRFPIFMGLPSVHPPVAGRSFSWDHAIENKYTDACCVDCQWDISLVDAREVPRIRRPPSEKEINRARSVVSLTFVIAVNANVGRLATTWMMVKFEDLVRSKHKQLIRVFWWLCRTDCRTDHNPTYFLWKWNRKSQ